MAILSLDRNWTPHRWLTTEEAIIHEATNEVLDHLGESIFVYHGGTNRITGKRSYIETSSIIVVDGAPNPRRYKDPILTNNSLFQRDLHICAYCGNQFKSSELTRDHIHPTSKGGKDTWMNVVCSCKTCNALKSDVIPGHKLPNGILGPQGTGFMDILYLPYVPCKAEHMILKNRAIKADQMQFLLGMIKNEKSRIFSYATNIMKHVDH